MALTTEQTLLLENLMYMESGNGRPFQKADGFEGQTVGEWLNSIDMGQLSDGPNDKPLTTADDWRNIIHAVKQDDTLMNMTILTTHADDAPGGGGGRSAVFVSESTGDAIVAFKGTESSSEWADNFTGGNVTDTTQQQNALEWYQTTYDKYNLGNYEVTVTGHSKGGNKAKYITLMDDTVDHCISFDGQGFSDKFMEEYSEQIAARQGKIENHNVDYDYVNILLNDVGETTYYKGYGLNHGGFLENHCPDTYMQFNEDGTFTINVNPDGQGAEMQALDQYFNSFLRSMPDGQRTETLQMVNAVLNGAFSINDKMETPDIINLFLDLAADPKYSDDLSYFLAYLIKYEQTNPKMAEQIRSVLKQFGMENMNQYVDIVDGILNFKWETFLGTLDFNAIAGMLGGVTGFLSDHTPDWVLNKLREWVKKEYGIELTNDQIRNLLKLVGMTSDNLNEIEIDGNGEDIRIPARLASGGSDGRPCRIQADVSNLEQIAQNLKAISQGVGQLANSVDQEISAISYLSGSTPRIKQSMQSAKNDLDGIEGKLLRLSNGLSDILHTYDTAEIKAAGMLIR